MHDREHDDALRLEAVEDRIGEAVQKHSPYPSLHFGSAPWHLDDTTERRHELRFEIVARLGIALPVPEERFSSFTLSFRRED